jgi:hypothetical protein
MDGAALWGRSQLMRKRLTSRYINSALVENWDSNRRPYRKGWGIGTLSSRKSLLTIDIKSTKFLSITAAGSQRYAV